MNALGVLIGGVLTVRTTRHGFVAMLGLAGIALSSRWSAVRRFLPLRWTLTASLSGLFVGITMPSRDMIVREVTPPGSFGRVFGFVSTGFNIGSMIAPMVYGTMMDMGPPRAVF